MASCIIINPMLGIIDLWTPMYAEAFGKLGYKTDIVSLGKDIYKNLTDIIRPDCRFFLAFADAHRNLDTLIKEGLFDRLGIPLVLLCIDHPEHYYEEIPILPDSSFTGLFDRFDIKYVKKYMQSSTNYFFLTDAGIFDSRAQLPEFEERDIDVLFCGSVPNPDEHLDTWLSLNSPDVLCFIENMADMLLANERLTPIDAFECCMRDNEFSFLYPDPRAAQINALMSSVSHYVRGTRRVALLKRLLGSGLNIHCIGSEDSFARFSCPNMTVSGSIYGWGYINALCRAKITINTSPLSQYALSERVPTSMLNGALAVTDMNPYMDQFFLDGRDVIAYRHNDYGDLPRRISEVLSNRTKWQEMTQNAYIAALKNHTFLHRAQEILEVLEQ